MSKPVIDQEAFESLKEMVGDDFIGELIDTFLEDAPDLMNEMKQALADDDSAGLRRAAHSLKSTSSSMGALQFAELARELEHLGRDGNITDAAPLLAKIENEYGQVEAALKELT